MHRAIINSRKDTLKYLHLGNFESSETQNNGSMLEVRLHEEVSEIENDSQSSMQ